MVTRDGHVKILDFGLAKLIESEQSFVVTEGLSQLATAVMQPRSTPGAVMGTVGYMSPEQAQGKLNEIDHRSDIFSFGCFLYEAITHHKPFEGKDPIESLNKTIRDEPRPLTTLASSPTRRIRSAGNEKHNLRNQHYGGWLLRPHQASCR